MAGFCKFVNMNQSSRMRSVKYHFLRDCGCTLSESHKMKDWTHSHIVQFLNANKQPIKTNYEKEKSRKESG